MLIAYSLNGSASLSTLYLTALQEIQQVYTRDIQTQFVLHRSQEHVNVLLSWDLVFILYLVSSLLILFVTDIWYCSVATLVSATCCCVSGIRFNVTVAISILLEGIV
jgi:hypothetical protein